MDLVSDKHQSHFRLLFGSRGVRLIDVLDMFNPQLICTPSNSSKLLPQM